MRTLIDRGIDLRSTKSRCATLIVALALLAPVASPSASAEAPIAVASHSCSAGYTHAALSWGHKCLRAGQYCKKGKNRQYHRYGYHCKRNGRLKSY